MAFSASVQFLPGIISILYWPQGNKKGLLSGLCVSFIIWLVFIMLPLFYDIGASPLTQIPTYWRELVAVSLIVNCIIFVIVSLFTNTSDEEKSSADLCALDTIQRRKRSGLVAKSPTEFIKALSKPLGKKTAAREVKQALNDLNFNIEDRRPYSMRLLRGKLEANLSGLLGPSFARELIDGYLPYSVVSEHGSSDLNVIENRIESYRSNLSGMATDLDNLRRYHRQILLDLPLGVCSLSYENEVIMWNHSLEEYTGISASDVVGSQLLDLPEPWLSLVVNFLDRDMNHSFKSKFQLEGKEKTVNLHKSLIGDSNKQDVRNEGIIILIEDITETEILEAGLTHSERLASIGRLAAGVAHEIGNPITGIACLAQTIRDEYQENELNALAKKIIEQTDRTSNILQSLVNFAHAGSVSKSQKQEIVHIKDCIQEAEMLISLDKKNKDIQYQISCSPDTAIFGDFQRILQVLVNVLNNARDASQQSSIITLNATSEADHVKIVVTDEGIGISKAIRDRVFDPFFTTKEPGEGTGLGLSLVFSIIEDLGGDIDIISPVNKDNGSGTSVVIKFPRISIDA